MVDWGIVVAAGVASFLTLVACGVWTDGLHTSTTKGNTKALLEGIEAFGKNDKNSLFFTYTFFGLALAFIWIAFTGFHWNVVVAFGWPYAAGYLWGRVQVKRAYKQPDRGLFLFALLLTILAVAALFVISDISQPFPSLLGTTIVDFGAGPTPFLLNSYALLGASGLVITGTFLATLYIGTGRDLNVARVDLKRKIEEEKRKERESISDEGLRAEMIQQLNQGKIVSSDLFPDVSIIKIRNAMAALEQELSSAALMYDAVAMTIAYRNALGVRRLHEACSEITQKVRSIGETDNNTSEDEYKNTAKTLAQLFLTELGLPAIASDAPIQLRHKYFICSGQAGKAIRGLPSEFPIFIPMLNDQQAREDNIKETFQELFNEKTQADGRFGLILSPNSSPFLRNTLTQPDELGIKENVAFLDEEEIRAIITSKSLEPRAAFLKSVGKQVRFALVTPFHTRGQVVGEAFVGRDKEISDLFQNIASRSYVILGARRIGKTSLIQQVAIQLQQRGYRVVYLDCQNVLDYQKFFEKFNGEIYKRWPDQLRDYAITEDHPIAFEHLVSYLSRSTSPKLPLVFIFDEIDGLLGFDMDKEHPEMLFRTFRALSQEKACQFIFCGERRIYDQLHEPSSPLFNFPIPIKLGLLSNEDAQKLIEKPLTDLGIIPDDSRRLIEIIVDECSRHPNLLQEMGQRVLELIDRQPQKSDPMVTEEIVLQVKNHPEFRKLYEQVFWSQSTPLEKAITLLVPSEGYIQPSDIATQLKHQGFKVSQKQLDGALDFLILYCIFQQESSGIRWAATHFKEVLSKTIFDEQEYIKELLEKFSR